MSMPVASHAARRLRVLWILLFWLIVGGAAYIFGVLNTTGQRVEENALSASEFNTDPPAPLGLVSPGAIAIALVVIGLIALWVHGISRALISTLVPAAAIVASQLLKSEVLARPNLASFVMENSFPSGHMTVFVALVGGAVFAAPKSLQALLSLGGAVLLGVVGWQLMAYGWHRPSDVLGALALGAGSFAVVTLFGRLLPTRGVLLVRTTSLTLALTGWLLIACSLVTALIAGTRGSAELMLQSGQTCAIGLSALAAHSIFRLAILSRSAKE